MEAASYHNRRPRGVAVVPGGKLEIVKQLQRGELRNFKKSQQIPIKHTLQFLPFEFFSWRFSFQKTRLRFDLCFLEDGSLTLNVKTPKKNWVTWYPFSMKDWKSLNWMICPCFMFTLQIFSQPRISTMNGY